MHIPCATYRLQFRPEFGFSAAAAAVAYLCELGITDVYASPILQSRPGSLHGYDCVNPQALDPELGSRADWHRFTDRLRASGMGLVLDIVPNHMAYHAANPMLADILENGPASRFHDFFDICWNHPSPDLHGKLMAPFLGRRYRECLEKGEIRLAFGAEGFAATYGDLAFPLQLQTWAEILEEVARGLGPELGDENPDYLRLLDALDHLETLGMELDPAVRAESGRAVKQTLWDLFHANEAIGAAISAAVERFNGRPGDIGSYQALDRLLSRQRFRLCFWQMANEEINYRRFFDINELIALRQENEAVFEHTHALLGRLAVEKRIRGVRVDHIDGLSEPGTYLRRLRRLVGKNAYVVVEKILAPDEPLPHEWPVQGTTGYDFAHRLNGLFVCTENEARFNGLYSRFSGVKAPFEEIVYGAKKEVLENRLAGDLGNLSRRMQSISPRTRFAGHLTTGRLETALSEILARFPVYRTYLGEGEPRPEDRAVLDTAVSRSLESLPELHFEFDFIRNLLTRQIVFDPPDESLELSQECRKAARAFQQLSSALMAKGFEDTALYRYHRLASLNEVGGEPDRFGCTAEDFHEAMVRRSLQWPCAMNSTATHDSKRGEDVRARLNVLSEMPELWEERLQAWHRLNRQNRVSVERAPVPDRNTEYLLYQTLIGAWPREGRPTEEFARRIRDYMIKAAREAGQRTSWADRREGYETALAGFVDRILDPSAPNGFLSDFVPFCKRIAFFGCFNSLSQCVIKIAAPGVPDFYQGTELPQLVLVDPDNRRPVSHRTQKRLLTIMRKPKDGLLPLARQLLKKKADGRVKLFVVARALQARRGLKRLFQSGAYLPLRTGGAFADHMFAFARNFDGRWCIAAVPRFVSGLVAGTRDPLGESVWRDTAIHLPAHAPAAWRNVFTGQKLARRQAIAAADALKDFPVALLVGEERP